MPETLQQPETGGTGNRLKSEMRVYYGPSQQKLLTGFTVDLSAGGLYLQTETPFKVDDKLILHFKLPEMKKIVTCNARVAWTNPADRPRKPELPAGIGVQFTNLPLDDLKSIRRFLEYNEIEPTWSEG